jgi:predicted flavoprotein YhiN
MMVTHFGIGGPVTLLMSLSVVDALAEGPVSVAIDLKPALERRQLQDRLQRDFDQYGKRGYRRILAGLLPMKMIEPFIQMTGIPADKPAHQITSAERDLIAGFLKSLRFNIRAPLPMSSAIVTAGGVSLQEIDPRTMASRLIRRGHGYRRRHRRLQPPGRFFYRFSCRRKRGKLNTGGLTCR